MNILLVLAALVLRDAFATGQYLAELQHSATRSSERRAIRDVCHG